MRSSLFSLLLMFAAAVFVMVGGERLSRREEQTRTPLDRDRLFDFDQALRAELGRLDSLYQSHLMGLAETLSGERGGESKAREVLSGISGVLRMQVFSPRGASQSYDASLLSRRLPEILLGDGARPLNPEFAVVLGKDFDPAALPAGGLWRETRVAGIQLFLVPGNDGGFIVFFIDRPVVHTKTRGHLLRWLESPLAPVREAGERVRLTDPAGEALVTTGPERFGPAAAILPIRTSLGTWQIEAWDGVAVRKSHDHLILITASGLAVLLVVGGILLFLQQRRAIRLASERVSFVNRVSHELGAPLTNVMLNLELARDHLPAPPPAALHRLDLVNEELQRLSRLVANVLTFSRKERDAIQLHPAPCIPADVVSGILETFRPALERRGMRIETDLQAGDEVVLDPDALAQITGNLVSNVEKYAFSGGWMHLRAALRDGWLEVEVRDRGPGIPAAHRKRIFAPFARVHQAVNEGSSGTGLGLAIARELARRMGGDLELLASDEGGAFRLRVPAPTPSTSLPTEAS